MTTRLVRATTAVRAATVDTAGMEAAIAVVTEARAVAATEAGVATAEAAGMVERSNSRVDGGMPSAYSEDG